MVLILVLLMKLLLPLELPLGWRQRCCDVQGSPATCKQSTRFSPSGYCHSPMAQVYMGLNQITILLDFLMVGRSFVYCSCNFSFILHFDFSHNSRAAASSVQECTGHYEEPICFTENNYVMEPIENKRSEEINAKQNEGDCVAKTQESEYEEGDNVGDPAVLYR